MDRLLSYLFAKRQRYVCKNRNCCMTIEALCSAGAGLSLLVGHQGCEGATWQERQREPPGQGSEPSAGSAGSLGCPHPVLKCKYIFQIKYTDAILSTYSTRKLLWFEITKMLIALDFLTLLRHLLRLFSAHFRSLFPVKLS